MAVRGRLRNRKSVLPASCRQEKPNPHAPPLRRQDALFPARPQLRPVPVTVRRGLVALPDPVRQQHQPSPPANRKHNRRRTGSTIAGAGPTWASFSPPRSECPTALLPGRCPFVLATTMKPVFVSTR